MPMPDEAVMSTELEKQWMDPNIRAMWVGKKPSCMYSFISEYLCYTK